MNAAELAERLSRPAPRFLIALDVPPESRAQLAADQQHQFERGLLLWGRTGHQQAMDLMRETLAVLGSLQRDPVARQFCWLAEGALESCKDRSPATREILNALSQQVRSLATQTFTLPEALALSLWQRISVTGGGETAAALRRHLNAPAPVSTPAPAAPDIPTISDIAPTQPDAPSIPTLDLVDDAIPTVDDIAPTQPDADIPDLSLDWAVPDARTEAPVREPIESVRWVAPSSSYALPTRMEVPPLLPANGPAPAIDIPELSIGDALPPAAPSPAIDIPELSIGDALAPADTAPAIDIPELSVDDALAPADTAPSIDIPELSVGDALTPTGTTPAIPELVDPVPAPADVPPPPPAPAPLPELPLIANAPFAAPRQALSIEPHPQAAVFAALAAALQSNWQRIANGSTSHFNLFRDALVTLNDGLPSLGTPALARLASALLTHADELPVCGPAADEGERVAEALDSLTDCLKRWPKLGEDDIEALEAHQRALTEMPQAGTPLPEGELQQLAADMQSLSATPADPVPAPPPAPASISLAEVPHLYAAPTDADVPSNAAIERAALGVAAQAHLTELIHGRSRASAGGGIDNDMVQAAQALAAEAEAAGETALGSLAAAFAAALDASRFHPEPVLEIGADIIAVLVDMIGSVQRGEPVEGAEDLVEVLVELTPKVPPSLSLPEEPASEPEQEQEPAPAPAASPAPAFELPDLSFDEEVMPPSAMEPEPEPDTPWPNEMPDLGDDLPPR